MSFLLVRKNLPKSSHSTEFPLFGMIRIGGDTQRPERESVGNFKDARFYPILNFGLFWAPS